MTVRRSIGISAASQGIIFAVQFSSVIAVSRILTPEEIGIFSVSAAFLGFAHIFRDFGVAQYLIQASDISHERLRAAFTVALGLSWLVAATLLLLSPVAAAFYDERGVAHVLGIISLNFLILPFGTPILALLRREMRFDVLALVQISNAVVSSAVTIIAALLGASYLSMALGAVAGISSNVLLLNILRPGELLLRPTRHGLRDVVRFGSMTSAASIMSEISLSAPDLILGRTLGFSDVAFYSRANGLRQMALRQILTLVRSVYLPSFAQRLRAGDDPADMYLRSMTYIAAVTAPALAVLAILAKPTIIFLFGDQWARSASLSSVLCAASILATPVSMAPTSLTAAGHVRVLMQSEFYILCSRVGALASSIWLQLDEVVLLFSATYFIEFLFYGRALKVCFSLPFSVIAKRLARTYLLVPFAAAGPAAIVLIADSHTVTQSPAAILAAALVAAFVGWLLGVIVLKHPFTSELRRALALLSK